MSKRIAVIAGALATLAAPHVAAAAQPADTVLRNGRVYTADARDSIARAVALRDGRIAYVGSDRGVRRFVGPRTDVVDLRGRMAMPGLVDGHAHPLAGGDILDDCDLGNADATIAELQEVIRACDAADPASDAEDWLQVSNWSPVGVLPAGTVVSRTDLDAISTTRPIFVSGSDGHNAWVNSRALELAGVTKDTPDPADGEIVRDPDGTPRGLLKDGAIGLVSRAIPAKTKADDLRDARRAQRALNAAGITTVMDAAAGRKELRTWSALARRGGMDIRMSSFVALESAQSPNAAWRYASDLRKRFTAPGLTIHGVKLFLDGVIEAPAQTAALLEPYLVERGGAWVPGDSRGSLYFTPKQIAALSAKFDAKRWRIHMHAIGDWAVRAGLDGAEAARKANGSPASRRNFAITHLQLVDPSDYPRFRKLGVFANMQLQWANRSTWTEEALAAFIGPERHRLLYPARSLVDAGAPFSQGSDWPVDPLNPWLELETAQTRTLAPRGPLYPEQSIPIKTALRAHTIGSARQLGLQRTTGSLERGKSADVIVLDRDVLRVAPAEVAETEVLRTWLRGRTVYRKR